MKIGRLQMLSMDNNFAGGKRSSKIVATYPDEKFFFSNDVKLLPYLSNWEIKIFTAIIPELSKYEVSNFYLTLG